MGTVPVFAGLGSELLFDESIQLQAIDDSRSHQGHILIATCHELFVKEITAAGVKDKSNIDLQDFQRPQDILRPRERYHRNPAIQHATLTLIQLLRYQRQKHSDLTSTTVNDLATAGFCVGLFAAVAVATAHTSLDFITRSQQCFRASLLLGLAVERSQRSLSQNNPLLPWSLVVKNVQQREIDDLIALSLLAPDEIRTPHAPVYISARNSSCCFTVSGQGDALQDFVTSKLPEHCSIRPTNLYGLYHSRPHLQQCRDELISDFETRSLPFPAEEDIVCPIISTIDGSLIQSQPSGRQSNLLVEIVDMILSERTDWEAVEERIISHGKKQHHGSVVDVCNYGPGYGALNHRKDLDDTIQVSDVSRQIFSSNSGETDIAIVGMGVDLPGAPDAETLWSNLMEGKSFCSEIPLDRFHVEDYLSTNKTSPIDESRSMKTKYGNFLDDAFLFDPELFGVSPREAPSIDPQQRLMLQAVYRSLEDAGYVPDSTPSYSRESFGCFIGNATLDYVDNLKNNIDVYYSPGTLRGFLSGRISYTFKWSGPSITIDTACSSSITALHHAVRAILADDCRAAVVGGVNVMTSPDMYLGLDKAHFLSQTGQCKSFDASADGYCRSEGCTAFVLKRVSDAVAEKDRILGVIKSTALNQSGNSSSITHPHSPTQESLFHKLLSSSSIRPEEISFVEAHGTGTQAGDPNELCSIRNTFNVPQRDPSNPLHIGSIKSNIGHCEAASGGASLAKLLLMLKHHRIPPQALLQTLNPSIAPLDSDNTIISTSSLPWSPPRGMPRVAMLNNFGAAGSNAALLLQEHIPSSSSPASTSPKSSKPLTFVLGLSAKTRSRLDSYRKTVLEYLSSPTSHLSDSDLGSIAYTLTARRPQTQKFRISFPMASVEELKSILPSAQISEEKRGRENVFLFSGQGSQYPGMGRELFRSNPKFRAQVLQADSLLERWGFPACGRVLDWEEGRDGVWDSKGKAEMQSSQTAVYVLQCALAELLRGYEVVPGMVTGHSLGEYAALVAAGVMGFEEGLWVVAERARLIVERCEIGRTGMLAVRLGREELGEVLKGEGMESLEVSCENSETDCVVGGKVERLRELKRVLTEESGVKATMLDVPVAYHTAAVEPVLEGLRRACRGVKLKTPRIPIASNTLGRVVLPGEKVFTLEYFAQHCRSEVAFDRGIVDVLTQEKDFSGGRWIEVGPHPQLLPMVSARLASGDAEKFPALRKDKEYHETLADICSAIYRDGCENIRWRDIFDDLPCNTELIDMPPTPMFREKYFVPLPRETPKTKTTTASLQPETPFTLIEHVAESNKGAIATYETSIKRLARLIKGHIVCGQALCPGSVYGEMALAAAVHANGSDSKENIYKIAKINFTRPLLYTESSSQMTVRVTLMPTGDRDDEQSFEIASFNGASTDSKIHCNGIIKIQALSKALSKLENTEQALARRRTQFTDGNHQSFMTNIMYKIFGRVVDYGDDYQAVQKIYMDENAEEVFAECKIPTTSSKDNYAGQPVLLDTMLHVAGFAMNLNVDKESVCICHSVQSSTLLGNVNNNEPFDVHCSVFTSSTDKNLVMADAHAVNKGGIVAVIKGMQFRRQKLSKIQAAFEFATRFAPQQAAAPTPSQLPTPSTSCSPTRQSSINQLEPMTSADVTIVASDDEDEPPGTSVIEILSETTGVTSDKIDSKTELSSIGVDSMMIFEIEKKLTDTFSRKLGPSELSSCDTVEDVETLVGDNTSSRGTPVKSINSSRSVSRSARMGKGKDAITSSQVDHQDDTEPEISAATIGLLRQRLRLGDQPETVQSKESSSAPLYLIHPGAGMCHEYYRIGPLNRVVKAIHDPNIFADLKDDWTCISDMARQYADVIRDSAKDYDRIVLGGCSFGGIVAFETARILSEQPRCKVQGVVLIDAPPPIGHVPIARKTVDAAMTRKHRQPTKKQSKEMVEFEAAIGSLAVRNNTRRAAMLGKYHPSREGSMPRVVLLRSSMGFMAPGIDSSENVWLHDRTDPETGVREWEELTGSKIDKFDIPGDHFTPFEIEHIEGTTSALRKACELLDCI